MVLELKGHLYLSYVTHWISGYLWYKKSISYSFHLLHQQKGMDASHPMPARP